MTTYQLRVPGGASEAKQDEILAGMAVSLAELQQKLEQGQSIALDSGTLAALETVNAIVSGSVEVSNQVGLTDEQLRASDIDTADSGEREYAHVTQLVTASGDTTLHTPAAGKAIRLRYIYAINNPTSETSPLISLRLGVEEKYLVYAIGKRQRVTGPVDGALVVNLSEAGNVAVTALLEEI